MQTEIEAKFLDVDMADFLTKLGKLGGKQVSPERLMRRKILDYPGRRLDKKNAWVRVRDEGNKITVSYKQQDDNSLNGTKEANIVVNDFDAAVDFLLLLGLEVKSYQETRRESWVFDDCEIEVDTWPWIPPYIEIETGNDAKLKKVVQTLGLDWDKALHGSIQTVYMKYYSISPEEINGLTSILFEEKPEFLRQRQRDSVQL